MASGRDGIRNKSKRETLPGPEDEEDYEPFEEITGIDSISQAVNPLKENMAIASSLERESPRERPSMREKQVERDLFEEEKSLLLQLERLRMKKGYMPSSEYRKRYGGNSWQEYDDYCYGLGDGSRDSSRAQSSSLQGSYNFQEASGGSSNYNFQEDSRKSSHIPIMRRGESRHPDNKIEYNKSYYRTIQVYSKEGLEGKIYKSNPFVFYPFNSFILHSSIINGKGQKLPRYNLKEYSRDLATILKCDMLPDSEWDGLFEIDNDYNLISCSYVKDLDNEERYFLEIFEGIFIECECIYDEDDPSSEEEEGEAKDFLNNIPVKDESSSSTKEDEKKPKEILSVKTEEHRIDIDVKNTVSNFITLLFYLNDETEGISSTTDKLYYDIPKKIKLFKSTSYYGGFFNEELRISYDPPYPFEREEVGEIASDSLFGVPANCLVSISSLIRKILPNVLTRHNRDIDSMKKTFIPFLENFFGENPGVKKYLQILSKK